MTTVKTISDLDAAVRFRRTAYGEVTAAREALEEAQNRLKTIARSFEFDDGRDPVLSAAMRGREAIARIRVEEARERLREAQRDLQRARQLSAPITAKEFEIEHID